MSTSRKSRSSTVRRQAETDRFVRNLVGGTLGFGDALLAIREADEVSQVDFAETLGISRQQLCDIEKGRKAVSVERAIDFARTLGYSEKQFVRLLLQDMVHQAGSKLRVDVA